MKKRLNINRISKIAVLMMILLAAVVTLAACPAKTDKYTLRFNLFYDEYIQANAYEVSLAIVNKGERAENSFSLAPGYNIVIPEAHNGLPVTKVADYGFQESNFITPEGSYSRDREQANIILPDTILTIGDYAFGTRVTGASMKSINIPPNLISIGDYGYAHSRAMPKELLIPKTVVG